MISLNLKRTLHHKIHLSTMKTIIKTILFLVLGSAAVHAQGTFQKVYGGAAMDEGKSVRATADGGYIIAGTTTSYGVGGRDILVIKTNALGDTSWTKTFGGAIDNEYGFCVQQTSDEGYIVSGIASSFFDVAGDIYLIKLNSVGDTIWTRTYGGLGYEAGAFVEQTSDGGFILAGQTPAFGAGGFDAYLLKLTASGAISWTKTFGGIGLETAAAVQQTSDGGYILAGQIETEGAGSGDFYLVKTDEFGEEVWTKSYGRSGTEGAVSVQQTTDGGYIIGGTSENELGPLGPDLCLVKTNELGDTLWSKLYGGDKIDECYEVIQTSDGGYIMVGKSFSFSENEDFDVYVVKVDEFGTEEWSKTYGNSEASDANEMGNSIQQTADGGYVIVGESMFGFGVGIKNTYLIKTDISGTSNCNEANAATSTTNYLPEVNSPTTTVSSGGEMAFPSTQVSFGTTTTSLCSASSGINQNGDELKSISIYPNPFDQEINILLNDQTEFISFAVYEFTGQLVYQTTEITNQTDKLKIQLNLSELASGIYLCTLETVSGEQTFRLVKR